MDDGSSKTALKATSGVLSGFSGALLLGLGLLTIFLGQCTTGCGSWLIKEDRNGTGTFLGPFVEFGGNAMGVIGAIAVFGGFGFIATAVGFGISIFKRKPTNNSSLKR